MAETGLSHRLTGYKIISLDCHIGKYLGVIRAKIVFLESVTFHFHAQLSLRGRTVIKKLRTFFGPWGRDLSQSLPCWILRVYTSIHGLGEDDTARDPG